MEDKGKSDAGRRSGGLMGEEFPLSAADLENLRRKTSEGAGLEDLKEASDRRLFDLALHALSCDRCRELLYTVVFGAEAVAALSPEETGRLPVAGTLAAKSAHLRLERAGNGMRVISSTGLSPIGAFKGFPPGLPIAAVSELKFQKENGPGSFALAVTDRGRSVCLTFIGDRKADVEARGYSAAVSRQGSGRFTVDLAQELELLIRSGAGESTLTLSATDVAEISDAPALLAIYADAASGRSARELQKRRKDVLSGLQGERRSLFAAALDALTLEAAPLTLHLGGPRPSENRRRQWREILGSLALTGHLDDLAARPCLAPFKEDLSLVFGLVTDGLVNEAERRVSGVIASLGDAVLPGEPDQQALGYLYALDGWLLVCQQEHERALLVFNRVLGFHGACPGADLAPWARSAHYFADMGGRVATRFIREPETPFREAVFSSLVECLA